MALRIGGLAAKHVPLEGLVLQELLVPPLLSVEQPGDGRQGWRLGRRGACGDTPTGVGEQRGGGGDNHHILNLRRSKSVPLTHVNP